MGIDTVAFIPVRGESKSIPKKNVRSLAGRPLLFWTLDAALNAKTIERVYVSSEDATIREIAGRTPHPKLSVISRSPETATDVASTESALIEFAKQHDFSRAVLIQATSPLLQSSDLDGAMALVLDNRCDSLLSVTRRHDFRWEVDDEGTRPLNYHPLSRPRRQDWTGELYENGAFYITSRKHLLQSGCRLSGAIGVWEMPQDRSIEIDNWNDWYMAEALLTHQVSSKILGDRCKAIKVVLTDVDGVLTDGGMYYGENGEELKKFNTKDGKGFELLQKAGMVVGIISQEDSPATAARARKLGLDIIEVGTTNKMHVLEALLAKRGLQIEAVAYLGDDLNDLEILRRVGLSACPADAQESVLGAVHYRCRRTGGSGCFRELADLILSETTPQET